ncbi:MAG TPA: polysaccharide biosynthesis protein [Rhodospirillales bacterium]|nr:polysaccharide biosynthesis protein [Rhodospirillales bacterium]
MTAKFPRRGYYVYAHDVLQATASLYVSLYLRLGTGFVDYFPDNTLIVAGFLFAIISAVVFHYRGLYRGVWRYASINDLTAITRAVTLVILLFLAVMFLWSRLDALPRSLVIINWFVLMAMLGGPRFLYRLFKDRRFDLALDDDTHRRIPVLLAGAGDAAEEFIRSLGRSSNASYRVAGILSESQGRVGRNIRGVMVLGTTADLAHVVDQLSQDGDPPQRLILTKQKLDGVLVRTLLDDAARAGLTLARLPSLTEFKSGEADSTEIRPIDIEDLLGRPQKPLDRQGMRAMIEGKRVLVTGAGGSIGSELVRQITDFAPAHLSLLDSSEFALYSIDLETGERHPGLNRQALIADVRDRGSVARIMADLAPQLVFHAAALKHVPLVEANPFAGIMTNIIGTLNVADACRAANVDAMVMISTDKAVNPTNIMGATKRIAESYCQAMDLKRGPGEGTRFVTVRFGNVLGSTGSVVPLFQKQLSRGGPLTVTDERMTRYFMTVGEAVELVLQAATLNDNGQDLAGKIFVLDMGDPVRIIDLAEQMIRLAGLIPGKDIKIEMTGLRPGEKLFEEMFHGGEPLVETRCAGILLAAPRAVEADTLGLAIDKLAAAATAADRSQVIKIITDLVPEYKVQATN